jgi:hypothetical protein
VQLSKGMFSGADRDGVLLGTVGCIASVGHLHCLGCWCDDSIGLWGVGLSVGRPTLNTSFLHLPMQRCQQRPSTHVLPSF